MFSIGIRIQEMKQNNSKQSYRNLRDGAEDKGKDKVGNFVFSL
jgi:hypothetical protein